ncbi:hypothetical protein HW273_00910 [Oribacterium sp. oral taxon 102]|uniref:hypothetical protein n=1 Tax=Oribacterium sp. oral taxon 102 TaxID=671214 RepID=UPI0015B94AD3|nr:hypothetical protein [Oribacterium sp. oral taxon 102]NWO20485.1 hypothetical protein [Oribacterium sp. oral taxon 102]
MRKTGARTAVMAGLFSVLLSATALANIRSLEINADMDSIASMAAPAGTAFLPTFEIEDEDAVMLDTSWDSVDALNRQNPTIPYTLRFRIRAEQDVLDDDLRIRGRGFRASYVDLVSADNTEARGRLLVYPFYQLVAPTGLTLDPGQGRLSWSAGDDYAGAYELVLCYTKKNGELATLHRRTKNKEYNVGTWLNESADHTLAAAVRALPTEEIGYERAALDTKSGTAGWTAYDGAESYRMLVKWTDQNGREQKHEETVKGTSRDVSSYVRQDRNHSPKVLVRAVPKQNDAKYYNIAVSDWARLGSADTSDYEIDDVWELLADYQGVTEGAFASLSRNAGGSPNDGGGSWQREGYRFRYLMNGTAYNGGWKKLGGSWYYFDADGFMHTGWLTLDGRRYYFSEEIGAKNGSMLTGEQSIKGQSYRFSQSGELIE